MRGANPVTGDVSYKGNTVARDHLLPSMRNYKIAVKKVYAGVSTFVNSVEIHFS